MQNNAKSGATLNKDKQMVINNLSDILCVIEVQGADSKKFLQGQLTNDINLLDEKPFQFSAHLNNKGRMLASFIITKAGEDCYYLITSREIEDKIFPRLKMFVLRSKVIITQSKLNVIYSNNTINFGYTIEVCPQHFISLSENLAPEATKDITTWKNTLINSGIPLIYASTVEAFIPQHVNFDLFDGVNFKKGCYTGQEIVARTHYLGKVKRRMFHFISDSKPVIGQKVVSPLVDNQEIGIIVDVIQRDYNYLGLVAMQVDCIDKVFLDKENRQQLLIQSITY